MHLNLAVESTFFAVRLDGKELPFKFKHINTYEANQRPGEKKEEETYHWREVDGGRKQEPNDTLLDGNHMSESKRTIAATQNHFHLTCFQSSCPRENVPAP